MKLRTFAKIYRDIIKAVIKKLKRDKLIVLKFLLYTAYVVLSAKKAVNCISLLVQQFRQKHSSLSLNVLSVLYLVFIFV